MSDNKKQNTKKYTYKDYVKPKLIKEFKKELRINRITIKDFKNTGYVTTGQCVMRDLMQHKFKGKWKDIKLTPKEAWENMVNNSGHSAMSAALTAVEIAHYSPRGKEFKDWCIKDDVVLVDWRTKKKKVKK